MWKKWCEKQSEKNKLKKKKSAVEKNVGVKKKSHQKVEKKIL